MSPLPPPEERTLRAVGARRAQPGAPTTASIVATLRALAKESPALVALFDARAVAGERHLLSAWAHLGRARSRGESRLRDRGAEFALYVAGDDQLPRALAKVGVSDTTEQFVLVAERPLDPATLLPRFELTLEPSAYPRPVDESLLNRLGIEEAERRAVPATAWEGLVLERVALLDLSAPAAHPAPTKH
ncbi:MAG TPA: KEOPS complex subunit Cgi121 [Thermoplasmata archaeon]|jgi:tRNA threonylcarbamoyladenosine modification (KEOPS) complex Cgi121 subunit|nr:KEOPS complex subunit Cgi121 [Thermoplasmata archaeon]